MKSFLHFFKSALSLLLAGMVALQADAADSETVCEVDGLYYRVFDTDGYAIVVAPPDSHENRSTYSGNIVVPSHINLGGMEYRVDEIGMGAFRGTDIKSIYLPYTVWYSEEGSYMDLTLDSLSIPGYMSTDPLTYDNTHIKRMIIRADEYSTVGIGDRNLHHGILKVDTLDVASCNSAFIKVFEGEIGQLRFRHLDEVWPDYYVFYHCKDPETPEYIIMDDEVPPLAMGDYADITTIGGSLLFVPHASVSLYEEAAFWKTARGIYPKSRLPELEELLATDAVDAITADSGPAIWSLDGRNLDISLRPEEGRCVIHDIAGRYIRSLGNGETVTLQPGVYILTHGKRAERIIVR